MRAQLGRIAVALIASGLFACSSSTSASEATFLDAESSDGQPDANDPVGAADADDASPGEEPDANLPPRVPPERTGMPLPQGVRPPVRILDDHAELVGSDLSRCTNQDPASANGDRWCAFSVPGAAPSTAELWVMNVSAVAATGEVPPCDGTSEACLRLTQTMWLRSGNGFDGDTLIFYADATAAPGDDFVGPVYAWRPGWPQARQISSDRGVVCLGSRHAAVAACLDDPDGDPKTRATVALRVGYLSDAAGGALPALDGRWPLGVDPTSAWQAGFSPDGETFAVSNPPVPGGVESLAVLATKDAGTIAPLVTIDDIQYWTISNDSQKIYFLRGQADDPSLFVADFPTGTGIVNISPSVGSFALVGAEPTDRGLVFTQKSMTGDVGYQLVRDRDILPTDGVTVFTYKGFLEGAQVSADLRYTVWVNAAFHARVVRNDDLTVCELNTADEPPVFRPAITDGAGLVFWRSYAPEDPARNDGFYAPPDRCREKQRFGQGIGFYSPVGDRGLVFGDERTEADGPVTLKYAAPSADAKQWPTDGAVRIHENVEIPVSLVGSPPSLVVYRALGDAANEAGTYVFGPLPF